MLHAACFDASSFFFSPGSKNERRRSGVRFGGGDRRRSLRVFACGPDLQCPVLPCLLLVQTCPFKFKWSGLVPSHQIMAWCMFTAFAARSLELCTKPFDGSVSFCALPPLKKKKQDKQHLKSKSIKDGGFPFRFAFKATKQGQQDETHM